MSNEPDILVRYVRNADSSVATEAIKFHDDDRPDLLLGEVGYVTAGELHNAAAYGVTLEQIEEAEARELGLLTPEDKKELNPEPKPLSEMSEQELKDVAELEGVDLTGKRSNAQKVEAIEAKRAEQPSGRASLPATASTGTGPVAGGSATAGSGPGAVAGGSTAGVSTGGTTS